MTNYSHIAHRVFNRPHLVDPDYARVFVGALSERLDIRSLAMPDGTRMERPQLRAAADTYEPGERSIVDSVDGIAIIPVEGTLAHKYGHIDPFSGMTGYDGVQAKVEEALEDPNIRGILLDINSPGGEVSGCFDLADFLYEARQIKPVWALADEWAASAAYALASSAQRVIAPRTAELGSIGVLTMHVDQSQMLAENGLDVTFIYAGDHKVDGNPFEPLPDEVRADIQADIDELYGMFVRTVARNRGMSEDAVRATQAQVYQARGAREVGLADDVMAAREVLPAFDEFLRGQERNRLITTAKEVADMSLSLFRKRGRKAEEPGERPGEEEEAAGAAAAESTEGDESGEETPTDAGTAGEDTGQGAGEDAPPAPESGEQDAAASAETIVSLCTEAHVPQLANNLIRTGVSLAEVRARIQDARDIRDACAAAGLPHLGDKAVEAIDQQRFAGFIRSALTEATAIASGEEVSHHQPPAQPSQGPAINAVQFYRGR